MSDLSDRIADEVLRCIGGIDAADPVGNVPRQRREALKAILGRPDALEVMAQAHDAEDSAQMGEPTPWRDDIAGQDEEWKSERRAAMLCALQAVGLA